MNNITVCVVSYNRPKSLIRILNSLSQANYDNDKITLYISIDKDKNNSSENQECFKIATDFNWNFGEKVVDYKKENLGLRKHILQCGCLTNEYENVIVFEDDIVVSPDFYLYAKSALNFYNNDDRIAGFGIYSFPKNPANRLPFYPLNIGYDSYFMQYACSWGQMWTKKQWNLFYAWYKENSDKDLHSDNFPDYIANWKDSSWLKYYMKYVVENNKYFVYPYNSYSTNFTDVGTHNKVSDIAFQTIISSNTKKFNFCSLDDSFAVYDVFFENQKLNKILNIKDNVDVNFYNEKSSIKNKYLLTTQKLNYHIEKSYNLSMYPYEQNIINNVDGNDLFLYDTSIIETNKINTNFNLYNYLYRLGDMNKKEFIGLCKYLFSYGINKFFNKIKKVFK